MRVVSLHVEDDHYRRLKSLAKAQGRPVAELIRDAMEAALTNAGTGASMSDIRPHPSGRQRRGWKRSELLDEMRSR